MQAQHDCNNFYPKVSPNGNYLYFSSDRDGANYEIYRTDIDGHSNPLRLTNSSGNKVHLSISPDGSRIVFQHGDYTASSEIYIMNADGSGLLQLTSNSVWDGTPDFSPNGQHIVFSAWDDSNYPEIFTMELDGSNRTQLTNQAGADWQYDPIYNPAGNKIYFSQGFNADNHYVMMDLDGSNWVNITEPNVFGTAEANLQFNEDGSKIIFFTSEWKGYNNGGDLVVANADGSNWDRITNSEPAEYYYYATYNPYDEKLYYNHFFNGEKITINKMDMDGTNRIMISDCGNVGVDESTAAKTSGFFHPNPVDEKLFIDSEGKFIIDIVDVAGHRLIHSGETTLDVSMLDKGIYLAILKDQEGKYIASGKLIKK